jgi:hypothetical protein
MNRLFGQGFGGAGVSPAGLHVRGPKTRRRDAGTTKSKPQGNAIAG